MKQKNISEPRSPWAALIIIISIVVISLIAADSKASQENIKTMDMAASFTALQDEGIFPSLSGATKWLNSAPLTATELRGKVVLIDFWTYSCINWLRTHPYVNAWAEKYKASGLVVIGVHTPEFSFEKNILNVTNAAAANNIKFPVAIDNNRTIWNAFKNEYWPAMYIIDAKGRIRHHQFGEGGYELSEQIIRQLLVDAGQKNVTDSLPVSLTPTGIYTTADWNNLKSGENYLGYERTENFVSPGSGRNDRASTYSYPEKFNLNEWALAGDWIIQPGSVMLQRAGGKLSYKFHARDLHMVLSALDDKPVHFRISIDGKSPGNDHGLDVDANGNGVIATPRLYQLVRQDRSIMDRQFEIEFFDPGAEGFSVTFG